MDPVLTIDAARLFDGVRAECARPELRDQLVIGSLASVDLEAVRQLRTLRERLGIERDASTAGGSRLRGAASFLDRVEARGCLEKAPETRASCSYFGTLAGDTHGRGLATTGQGIPGSWPQARGGELDSVSRAGTKPKTIPTHVGVNVDILTGDAGQDRFLFNIDGDKGTADRATDMSTFGAENAQDIEFINGC